MSVMSKYSGVIQSDRIFKIAGEWYFNTREGVEGPYENRLQAKNKLDVYLGIFGNLELADRSARIRSAMPASNPTLLPPSMLWR
jgi:uncharacterized protein DUF6316